MSNVTIEPQPQTTQLDGLTTTPSINKKAMLEVPDQPQLDVEGDVT